MHINTFISTEDSLTKAVEVEDELTSVKDELYKLIEQHYYLDSACTDVAKLVRYSIVQCLFTYAMMYTRNIYIMLTNTLTIIPELHVLCVYI